MVALLVPTQNMMTYPILSQDIIERACDPKDDLCPFNGYIGNTQAVRMAIRTAKEAFRSRVDIGLAAQQFASPVWACSREHPVRMLLTGPRSVGKTTYARCYGKLVGTNYSTGKMTMPWAEIDGTRVKKPEKVLESIQQALREADCPLIPQRTCGGMRYYTLPPMGIFIDEIHAVPVKIQECFLKMSESSDGIFEIGSTMRIDCRRAAMIVATTKPGKLDVAYKSRFPLHVELVKHTLDEVSQIIRTGRDWTKDNAMRLARMQPIPRQAKAIADMVDSARKDGLSVDKAITAIANDMGLQDGGLSQRAIAVLMSLADAQPAGLSKKNLCVQLDNMDETEFEQEIIPQLLRNEFHQALITISSRHKITESGLDELRKRGIINY